MNKSSEEELKSMEKNRVWKIKSEWGFRVKEDANID